MAVRGTLPIALFLLAAMALAGCSSGSPRSLPPEWKGRDLTQPGWQNTTVRSQWTLVNEYVWSSGTHVQWDWLTDHDVILYFQVVHVVNGQQQGLIGQHRDNSTGRISVPEGGQYDIIFRNEGPSDAHLWYQVPEGARQQMYPPGEGPTCLFLVAAADAC